MGVASGDRDDRLNFDGAGNYHDRPESHISSPARTSAPDLGRDASH